MSNVSYRDYPRVLQAGVPQRIGVSGDYWQLVKCTGEITLEFDQGVRLTRRGGLMDRRFGRLLGVRIGGLGHDVSRQCPAAPSNAWKVKTSWVACPLLKEIEQRP